MNQETTGKATTPTITVELTHEQLGDLIKRLQARISDKEAEIAGLRVQIAEFEAIRAANC